MSSRFPRLLAAAVAGAAAFAPLLAPVAMAERQGADLVLTIRYENSGEIHGKVILTCDPDGGSHPTPLQACDSLRRVDGNFYALPPANRPCSRIYHPVRVEAEGYWYGRGVRYVETFPNACMAAIATDDVFKF